jgi:hypothetical protein
MEVLKVEGRRVTARAFDPTNPTKRGRPYGVASVAVFSHVGGDVAPTDPAAYRWEGNATRMRNILVEFPADTAPGTKVWLCCAFLTERGLTSPACQPISTNVEFGGPAVTETA